MNIEQLQQKVRSILMDGIDLINEEREPANMVGKSGSEPLFGTASILGSLGLINLLLHMEETIEDDFGLHLPLTDSQDSFSSDGPLENLDRFVLQITRILHEKLN